MKAALLASSLVLGSLAHAATPAFAQAPSQATTATAAPQPATDPGLTIAIQRADDAFAQAFNRGDGAGVANLYTDSATILPPGSAVVKGREGIQAFWSRAITAGVHNLSLSALDVQGLGEVAREIGRFSFDAPGQSGAASRVEGKYVVVWRRQGSDWRLDTDIWNTDK